MREPWSALLEAAALFLSSAAYGRQPAPALELSTLGDGERRDLLIALEAPIDVESCGRMHEGHGLSAEEASAAWMRMIDRILPPTPQRPHGA